MGDRNTQTREQEVYYECDNVHGNASTNNYNTNNSNPNAPNNERVTADEIDEIYDHFICKIRGLRQTNNALYNEIKDGIHYMIDKNRRYKERLILYRNEVSSLKSHINDITEEHLIVKNKYTRLYHSYQNVKSDAAYYSDELEKKTNEFYNQDIMHKECLDRISVMKTELCDKNKEINTLNTKMAELQLEVEKNNNDDNNSILSLESDVQDLYTNKDLYHYDTKSSSSKKNKSNINSNVCIICTENEANVYYDCCSNKICLMCAIGNETMSNPVCPFDRKHYKSYRCITCDRPFESSVDGDNISEEGSLLLDLDNAEENEDDEDEDEDEDEEEPVNSFSSFLAAHNYSRTTASTTASTNNSNLQTRLSANAANTNANTNTNTNSTPRLISRFSQSIANNNSAQNSSQTVTNGANSSNSPSVQSNRLSQPISMNSLGQPRPIVRRRVLGNNSTNLTDTSNASNASNTSITSVQNSTSNSNSISNSISNSNSNSIQSAPIVRRFPPPRPLPAQTVQNTQNTQNTQNIYPNPTSSAQQSYRVSRTNPNSHTQSTTNLHSNTARAYTNATSVNNPLNNNVTRENRELL